MFMGISCVLPLLSKKPTKMTAQQGTTRGRIAEISMFLEQADVLDGDHRQRRGARRLMSGGVLFLVFVANRIPPAIGLCPST